MLRLFFFVVVIASLVSSCSPKIPVTVYLKNKTQIIGNTYPVKENDYYGIRKIKLRDENGVKHKYKLSEFDSLKLGNDIYESLTLKQRANFWGFPKKICMAKVLDGPMKLYVVTDYTLSVNTVSFLSGFFVSKIDYYYIRKTNEANAIRIYKTKNENFFWPTIIIQPFNRQEFVEYFSDVPEIQEKIKDRSYQRKNIYDLVLEYNQLKQK